MVTWQAKEEGFMPQLFVSYFRSWNGAHGLNSVIDNTVIEAEEPANLKDIKAITDLIKEGHGGDASISMITWKKLGD